MPIPAGQRWPAGSDGNPPTEPLAGDDLDGHHWDLTWMDAQAVQDGPPELTDEQLRAGVTTV